VLPLNGLPVKKVAPGINAGGFPFTLKYQGLAFAAFAFIAAGRRTRFWTRLAAGLFCTWFPAFVLVLIPVVCESYRSAQQHQC